jgi:DNA-binding CsgD family transcriptional regulator/PAS domain-containing protein
MSSLEPDHLYPVKFDDLSDYNILQKTFKSIKDKAELLQTIILANPFPMIVLDLEGCPIFANDSSMEIFGREFLSEDYNFLDDFIIKEFKIYRYYPEIKKGKTIKLPVFRYDKDNENPKWIESVLCPILDYSNKIEFYLFMFADITKKVNLRKENEELKTEIFETEITIKRLSLILQDERQNIKNKVLHDLKENILNQFLLLNKNETNVKTADKAIQKILFSNMKGLYDSLISPEFGLTPAEIRICGLIRNGLSGKEAAARLNVRYSTIHTHIKSIRKKLCLTGTGKNLQKYLMELS